MSQLVHLLQEVDKRKDGLRLFQICGAVEFEQPEDLIELHQRKISCTHLYFLSTEEVIPIDELANSPVITEMLSERRKSVAKSRLAPAPS